VGVDILGRHQSFAALPRVEAARLESLQSRVPLAALVEECDVLHTEVVPAFHKDCN